MKEQYIKALTEGIEIGIGTKIDKLTYSIWEEIEKIPYPINSSFKLLGDCSFLYVKDKLSKRLVDLKIGPDKIVFRLPVPIYECSSIDKKAIFYSTLAIMEAAHTFKDLNSVVGV